MQVKIVSELYLAAYHDMCDFGFVVAGVCLVISGPYGEHKISWVTLTFPHQETSILALLCQQLLSLTTR